MSPHLIARLRAGLTAAALLLGTIIAPRLGRAEPKILLRRRYRAAVAALPEDQRTVFTLHRVEEMSIMDISEGLNMPTSLVEEHLAAALLAIATALDAPR
jgi:DNA-directed RNA polymerase specialized sigma24 family protein